MAASNLAPAESGDATECQKARLDARHQHLLGDPQLHMTDKDKLRRAHPMSRAARSGRATRADRLRAQVRFATHRQPGQDDAAINGDAYCIQTAEWFEGKVPPEWMKDIRALQVEHKGWGIMDRNGTPVESLTGISMNSFHNWASEIPRQVDSTYRSGATFIGRGRNARAIQESLIDWADA